MTEDFYINLIYKSLSNEIKTDERKQLDDWLKQSEDNQKTAQEIQQVWEVSGKMSHNIKVDLNKEFSFLEEKMQKESPKVSTANQSKLKVEKSANQQKTRIEPEAKTNRIRPLWIGLAAASVLLFLVGGGVFLRSFLADFNERWVVVKTENETEKIVLADNSTVFLNANTTLEYPKKFTENNRLVKLDGEAFFNVASDTAKIFIVQTNDLEVQVLGTKFNVKAHSEQHKPSVHVASGKVKVQTNDGQKVELTKGEKAILNKKSQKLQEVKKASPNIMTWHTKKLVYRNTPLTHFQKDLKDWYDVELELNKNLKNCKITADFHVERENIDIVLEVVRTLFSCKSKQEEDGTYRLLGGKCR